MAQSLHKVCARNVPLAGSRLPEQALHQAPGSRTAQPAAVDLGHPAAESGGENAPERMCLQEGVQPAVVVLAASDVKGLIGLPNHWETHVHDVEHLIDGLVLHTQEVLHATQQLAGIELHLVDRHVEHLGVVSPPLHVVNHAYEQLIHQTCHDHHTLLLGHGL
eukprot:CAMPEP_0197887790 /NCGR_PEP_ID=MMETSP1439-20131203/19611_1 /TAXON_ID=66791 /ORGANISM="Gonyaulax spinifera, Strain CCMP409" /LENGTH=162 /DNA_ID=CAMNT_0043507645 /DNA_START=34 /DNA_END=523 /DNA_ORIENTATION=+